MSKDTELDAIPDWIAEHPDRRVRALLLIGERYGGDLTEPVAEAIGTALLPHTEILRLQGVLAEISEHLDWAQQAEDDPARTAISYFDTRPLYPWDAGEALRDEKRDDAIRLAELTVSLEIEDAKHREAVA